MYGDWCGWLANNEAKRADPESPTSPSERCKDTGNQVEGFCIPQFVLRKSDINRVIAFDAQEHWQPDFDAMTEHDPFVENEKFFDGKNSEWSYSLHGPVRKFQTGGFPNYEDDQTGFFSIQMPVLSRQWNGW